MESTLRCGTQAKEIEILDTETNTSEPNFRRAIVVGKKIFLRPMERSDISDDYLDWVNDQSLTTYILAAGFPTNKDRATAYFENSQPPNAVYFAICDNETGIHIGNARLSLIDWISRVATYGRLIGHPDYLGRGYGSDALIQLLRYGFHNLGLNRIWSSAVTSNDKSLGSNDKVGMKREGVLRQYVFARGKFHDTIVLAMLHEDFNALHGDPDSWIAHDKAMRPLLGKAPVEQDMGKV
jgi:RimJ/RimL family protein N-acetyltransferase